MRILWLSPYLPVTTFGAGTRVFNLLRVLAESNTIDLIAASVTGQPADEAIAAVRTLCRSVEIVPPTITSPSAKRLRQLHSLASRRSMHHRIFYSEEVQRHIDSAFRRSSYDVVIFESSFMGFYDFPDHVATVVNQHNVESEILMRSSQRERSALRRAYNLVEYWKFRSDERRICREVDLILASSVRDREQMLSWGDMPPCVVIPNGVDTAYFTPMERKATDISSARVVFTGTMSYSPNAEAMLYFAAEIWPRIERRVPGATLQIVGQAPPAEVRRLAERPSITVTGAVPDIRPYLSGAQVFVAPLRIGGGTRLKILEAMAMALPLVSTSLGCEGLEVEHGKHLMVADEPAEFADRVVELLRDRERTRELGREGRLLVEERYAWRALGRDMEAAVRDLLQEPSVQPSAAMPA